MTQTAIQFSPANTKERKGLDVRPGDTIRVWSKIQEKGKTRLQAFEGLVLARKHGTEAGATITVRKVSHGVGVERVFPLFSPLIDKVEILKRAKVRKSKLYYVRDKAVKEIRRKMKAIAMSLGIISDTGEEEIADDKMLEDANEDAAEMTEDTDTEEATETEAAEAEEENKEEVK